jgi:hypothetical protein
MAEQVAVVGLGHQLRRSGAVVADGTQATADGWTVRYELVVDGDAAEHLMSRQAAAVRALEYFAQAATSRPAQPGRGVGERRQRDRRGITSSIRS